MGHKTIVSSAIYTSGVATLLAASGALCAAALTLHSWTRPVHVEFEGASFSWLSSSPIHLAHAELKRISTGEPQLPEIRLVYDVAATLPKALRVRPPRTFVAKAVGVPGSESMLAAATLTIDTISISQAQADPVLEEASKMRLMHAALRQRFIAVVRGEQPSAVQVNAPKRNVEAVSIAAIQPAVPVTAQVAIQTKGSQPKRKIAVLKAKPAEEPVAKIVRDEAISLRHSVLLAQVETQMTGVLNPSLSDVTTRYAFEPLVEDASRKAEQISNWTKQMETSGSYVKPVAETALIASNRSVSAAEPIIRTQVTTQAVGNTTSSVTRFDYSHARVASASTGDSKNIQTDNQANTQPAQPGAIQAASHGLIASRKYVEAFDWTHEAILQRQEILTEEGAGNGWSVYHSADHWPTLTRRTVTQVPLISENTAGLLALSQSTRVQKEAGIIFGKVPDGWTVEFTGRSEKALFFNAQSQPISWATYEGERYFVFLNAAPGSHLIKLSGRVDELAGAVAVPVFAGTSTYLDLTAVKKKNLNGRVLNAGASQAEGLSRVRVRLLGHRGEGVVTDAEGFFEHEAVAFGDHPVLVETEGLTGFTHRYHVRPSKLRNVQLFRLDEYQVNLWISQLEGGISPESGMIVAALQPELFTRGKTRISPRVTTLVQNPTLVPETYTVSPDGQLQVQKLLNAALPRMVSVQIPEGATLVEAGESGKKPLWSQLVYSSPGVIDLISP